jgi:hypothetical protein
MRGANRPGRTRVRPSMKLSGSDRSESQRSQGTAGHLLQIGDFGLDGRNRRMLRRGRVGFLGGERIINKHGRSLRVRKSTGCGFRCEQTADAVDGERRTEFALVETGLTDIGAVRWWISARAAERDHDTMQRAVFEWSLDQRWAQQRQKCRRLIIV